MKVFRLDFGAEARQRLPDGEQDLLDQVLAQIGIGFIGHGDAGDQRTIIGDDPLERGKVVVPFPLAIPPVPPVRLGRRIRFATL